MDNDDNATRRPAPTAGGEILHVVLRDGTRILLRPIRPEDRDRLEAGFAKLSPEARYLRFHSGIDHLTDEQLRYFTEVDHRDHEAWVAVDEDDPEASGVGVGRYIRLAGEPTVAEAAITVLDDYQGRGLGTVLLALLERSAAANGIEVFRNYVLSENEVMLEVFEQLDGDVTDAGFGVHRIDCPISAQPDELPDTPAGRVLRQMSGRAGTLAFGPPLWLEDHSAAVPVPPRSSGHERGGLQNWLDEMLDD